jgi:hypothetical protein
MPAALHTEGHAGMEAGLPSPNQQQKGMTMDLWNKENAIHDRALAEAAKRDEPCSDPNCLCTERPSKPITLLRNFTKEEIAAFHTPANWMDDCCPYYADRESIDPVLEATACARCQRLYID